MRGIKAKNLVAIVDFICHGEANIEKDDLDGFLSLAEELQLNGLSGSDQETIYETKQPLLDLQPPFPNLLNPIFAKQED